MPFLAILNGRITLFPHCDCKNRKNVDSIKGRITASAVASNRAQACRAETTGCRDGRGAGVDCRAATETDFDFNLSATYD